MAKGMRSKSARANRAALRKDVFAPVVNKQLTKCLENLDKSVQGRTGTSLTALKSVMNSAKSMAVEGDEEVQEGVVKPDEQGLNVARKRDKIAVLKAQKRVGSKGRTNKGKELTWF